MRSYNLSIEHQCPQCGAPATLEETDRLFSCAYCRVRSYLGVRDFFRYRIPEKVPEAAPLFFIPYWRFKGMLFSPGLEGIQHRFLDVSAPAVALPGIPPSLGFRSQALKLHFVSPDARGHFVRPQRTLDEAVERLLRPRRRGPEKPVSPHFRIGETVSLIYAPFYYKKGLFDGVLNRPVPGRLPDAFEPAALPGGRPRWRIRFLACLCPVCGWDMTGQRDSLVLHCDNCSAAWKAAANGFKRLRVEHFPGAPDDTLFLPFWRIRADVEGMRLDSYQDLVRTANLPKAVQKGLETLPVFFWTPAFKIRPARFLRLTAQLTLTAPFDATVARVPKGRLHAVTLPVKEAVEALMPALTTFVKPRKAFLERLDRIRIRPISFSLVYFPFTESPHEWIQRRFNIVINKSALRLAGNL